MKGKTSEIIQGIAGSSIAFPRIHSHGRIIKFSASLTSSFSTFGDSDIEIGLKYLDTWRRWLYLGLEVAADQQVGDGAAAEDRHRDHPGHP